MMTPRVPADHVASQAPSKPGEPQTLSYFEPTPLASRTPAELQGAEQERPVVVVGAGPVGLTIALDLAQRNVPVLVIDKKSRVSMGSRALALSYRSLEILGRLGIVDRFLRDGMAWDSGRTIYAGHEISSFRIPQVEDAQYPGLLNLQQPLIETYLIDECNRRPNIEIQWQTELISMSELDSSVALAVVGPEGGYEIAAQWVVAADGARSKVRELTGCRLEGTTYNSMFVIVDIIMKSDHPPERRCWFDPPAFPGSTVLMHKQPFNVWRIDFQVSSDLDPDDVTHPDYVIPKVDEFLRSIGETADWELEWTSVYRAHALTLPRYRKGRVLFAGDAAHLLPIFGVRGLNSGMVDAANLTWKLALVIGGEADEALLDSYDAEQRDAFAQNASFAHLSTLFMTPPSRGTLLVRDAALDLALVREEFRAVADPRYSTPVDYFEGPLIAPDSDEWGSGPASGQLVPNLRIAAGPDSAFLNDVLGQDFAVLTFGGQLDAESLGSATMIDCDPSSPLGHALDASTDSVYVIRPDRHVLLRWRDTAGRSVADAIRQAMTGRNRILEAVSDG